MRKGWTMAIAACMLAPATGQAQGRSTRDGVYTARQAARGRSLYQLKCRSCHTPEGHSTTIKAKWSGHPLSEMYQFVSENMPKDSPGSLEPEEDLQAVAFLLQSAGMPAGEVELTADDSTLGSIRFDTLA